MFSLDNFYKVLQANLLNPYLIQQNILYPFGSTKAADLVLHYTNLHFFRNQCLFYDQEPIFDLADLVAAVDKHCVSKNIILANSELSQHKNQLLHEHNLVDWYYFFHGFAALSWFNDYQYFPAQNRIPDKVFISLNHLVSNDRSYRLNFVAQLLNSRLTDNAIVSCSLSDGFGTWEDEITRTDSQLSDTAKKTVQIAFSSQKSPLRADTNDVRGSLGAEINLSLQQSALWNIVTETVFYHKKLHLTEKIFKPIVAQQPFMLLGATGNLAYLKRYGFKTFGDFTDESYDTIENDDLRIAKVVDNISQYCNMTQTELRDAHEAMQPIVQHNYQWFYNDFKYIIVNELLENYKTVLDKLGLDKSRINFVDVQRRLCF